MYYKAIYKEAPSEHLSMGLTLTHRGGEGVADQSVMQTPLTHTRGGGNTLALEILHKCQKVWPRICYSENTGRHMCPSYRTFTFHLRSKINIWDHYLFSF